MTGFAFDPCKIIKVGCAIKTHVSFEDVHTNYTLRQRKFILQPRLEDLTERKCCVSKVSEYRFTFTFRILVT